MKKNILVAIYFAMSASVAFGQGKMKPMDGHILIPSAPDGNKSKLIPLTETIMSVPIAPSSIPGVPPGGYQSMVTKAYAQNSIITFNSADPNTNVVSLGFSIPATDLLHFISDAVGTDGIKYVQFLIGEQIPTTDDGSTPPPPFLELFVTGVGNMRQHIYIANDNTNQNVLQCKTISSAVVFEASTISIATNSENRIPIRLSTPPQPTVGSKYLANDATSMIAKLQKETVKNMTTTSFLYNATELQAYINQLILVDQKAIIQLFLGEDNQRLSLIILGAKSDNVTHIYFNDSYLGPCGLEHCIPCPTCYNIADAGMKL